MANIINISKNQKPKRKIIIITAVVVLLAVGAAATWFLLTRTNNEQQAAQDDTAAAAEATAKKAAEYAAEWQVANTASDYNSSVQELTKKLNSAADNTAKALAYEQLALVALNAGKYDEALAYAKQSDQANPTNMIAMFMGDIALKKGDKALARQYYQLVIDRTPESDSTSDEAEANLYIANEAKVRLEELK